MQVAAHGCGRRTPGPLEALVVARLGVGDVHLPLTGLTTMLKRMVPTPGEVPGGAGELRRRVGVGVDDEDVLVGQREPDLVVPDPVELVDPVGAVELDDEPGLRLRGAVGSWWGAGQARRWPRPPSGTQDARGGSSSGCRSGSRPRRPLPSGRHRQRARRVGEQRDDRERRAASEAPRLFGVEDPDVGAAHARRGELGIERNVLAAVGGGDEGAVLPGPANTMSRGSSPTSSVRTTRPCGRRLSSTTLTLSERWLTTQTSLSLRAATATGSRPTGRRRGARGRGLDAEDLEAVVGRVDGEEQLAVGDSASGRTWPLSKSVNVPVGPSCSRAGGLRPPRTGRRRDRRGPRTGLPEIRQSGVRGTA